MSHLLARLDFHASAGGTPWHRASALTKLALAVALVGAAVAAPGLALLLALHAVAWTLALTSGLPARVLAGESLGTLVVHGFERSERLYATMQLRGHSGRICGCRHWTEVSPADAWVAGAGLVLIAAAVVLWRWP